MRMFMIIMMASILAGCASNRNAREGGPGSTTYVIDANVDGASVSELKIINAREKQAVIEARGGVIIVIGSYDRDNKLDATDGSNVDQDSDADGDVSPEFDVSPMSADGGASSITKEGERESADGDDGEDEESIGEDSDDHETPTR